MGCGSDVDEIRELTTYDEERPLKLEQVGKFEEFTELTFQSPRGGDVETSLVLPPGRSGRVPAVLMAHAYASGRSQFTGEAERLAELGIASIMWDSNVSGRFGRSGIDVTDPVYAAETFEALLRQDVVDARRLLDILERRPEIDPERIGFVGHDYGSYLGGILAAVDDRIDAFVLAAGIPEASRHYADELLPPESRDGFAERLSRYDLVNLLPDADAPILLQNARRDRLVTVEEYERLVDAADEAEVRWYDADHELVFEAEEERERWLGEQLDVASSS